MGSCLATAGEWKQVEGRRGEKMEKKVFELKLKEKAVSQQMVCFKSRNYGLISGCNGYKIFVFLQFKTFN